MLTLKHTISLIKNDLQGEKKGFKTFFLSYLNNPSFRVLLNYRLGKYFYYSNNFIFKQIGRYYKLRLLLKRNCEISYNATIGKGIKFAHPIGVVIGDGVVIKDNVTIFQQVTFGSHGKKNKKYAYPVIESGVKIFAGAKIFGGITIGENAIIGANAVINIDVPNNCVAGGVPGKILKKNAPIL